MSGRARKRHFIGNFIGLEYGVMQSPAYRALDGDSLKIFLDIWSRYSHREPNNGMISYSVREAMALLGSGSDKATRCLRQLVDLGFLAIERKGAFSVKLKLATTWRITLLPTATQPATRDYQKWRPPAPKTGTDHDHYEKNTVPISGTNGTQNRYRPNPKSAKKSATVPGTGAVEGQIDGATVPRTGAPLDLAIGNGSRGGGAAVGGLPRRAVH